MTQNNEIPEGMLEFDLQKALDGWLVMYRDGSFPEEILFPRKALQSTLCIATVCKGKIHTHFKDGYCNIQKQKCSLDLFLKKKTRTQWAVVYHTKDGMTGSFCVDEEQAKANAKANRKLFPQIVSFELDEPEPQKKTKTYWVNVYGADGNKSISCNCVPYQSEADAINNRVTAPGVKCLKTISFDLDEPGVESIK
jgi:hypothetical protein